MAIDDLCLPMERAFGSIAPDRWEDTKYDGEIYAVPIGGEEYRINGFMFGDDIKHEPEDPSYPLRIWITI